VSVPRRPLDPRVRAYGVGAAILCVMLIAAMSAVSLGVIPTGETSAPTAPLEFVIPRGALAEGTPVVDAAIVIPRQLAFGRLDTAELIIRNEDTVAQRAGPWVVQPGQTFRIRFDEPGVYDFVCTQDRAQSVQVVVNLTDINGVLPAHEH